MSEVDEHGVEALVLCASSGFQRGDRASTSGSGKASHGGITPVDLDRFCKVNKGSLRRGFPGIEPMGIIQSTCCLFAEYSRVVR